MRHGKTVRELQQETNGKWKRHASTVQSMVSELKDEIDMDLLNPAQTLPPASLLAHPPASPASGAEPPQVEVAVVVSARN